MIETVNFLLDNIYVCFGNKLYRQVVDIPMGTNCAPLGADLFLYCNESQFMTKLSKDPSKVHLIDKFSNTYCYLDDIFSLNNQVFSKHTAQFYPKEITLNKSNINCNKCPFLDILVLNGKLYTKIYYRRNGFSFLIAKFTFLGLVIFLWHHFTMFIYQNSFTMPVSVVTFWILMNVINVLLVNYKVRDFAIIHNLKPYINRFGLKVWLYL